MTNISIALETLILLSKSSLTINKDYGLFAALNSLSWTTKSVLFEEFLFRGVLLYFGIKYYGTKNACIISAITFGAYHWFSYNIFYPQSLTQSNRGLCYLKNERSWKQWIKCLPYSKKEADIYFNSSGGYVGDFNYPRKFHFDCDQSWISDISLCLTDPRGGGVVKPN